MKFVFDFRLFCVETRVNAGGSAQNTEMMKRDSRIFIFAGTFTISRSFFFLKSDIDRLICKHFSEILPMSAASKNLVNINCPSYLELSSFSFPNGIAAENGHQTGCYHILILVFNT